MRRQLRRSGRKRRQLVQELPRRQFAAQAQPKAKSHERCCRSRSLHRLRQCPHPFPRMRRLVRWLPLHASPRARSLERKATSGRIRATRSTSPGPARTLPPKLWQLHWRSRQWCVGYRLSCSLACFVNLLSCRMKDCRQFEASRPQVNGELNLDAARNMAVRINLS